MPARHIGPGPSTGPSRNQGFLSTAYQELRAPENQSVLRSVAIFGAAVAIFASSWSDYLLPPL